MPVTVEAEVSMSRRRQIYEAIPIVAGLVFLYLLHSHVLVYLVWLTSFWLFRQLNASEPVIRYIRVEPERVTVWHENGQGTDGIQWQWRGQGRLSHAFIQWDLWSDDDEKLSIRIWQDAVSDASWRALNMCYRVNRAHAEQNLESPLS